MSVAIMKDRLSNRSTRMTGDDHRRRAAKSALADGGVGRGEVDALDVYLKQIGAVQRLTADEEVALAERIAGGRRALSEWLARLCTLLQPVAGEDETVASLCERVTAASRDRDAILSLVSELDHRGSLAHAARVSAEAHAIVDEIGRARLRVEKAKRRFTEANLRLVVSMARRYQRDGVRLLDLVQEGNLALMQAVDKFDGERGCRFSTYAVYWLRQAMGYALARQRRVVRLPRAVTSAIARVQRATREMQQSGSGEPSNRELAARCGMEEAEVSELGRLTCPEVSLDEPAFESDGAALVDGLIDESRPDPEDFVHLNHLAARLKKAIAKLPARERRIVRMRFGIGRQREHSLEQIGKAMGITRERIRQLEVRALQRLRKLVPEWQAV